MRLYHHPFSSNSRRVVLTAAHLNIPLEMVLVDLAKGEQRAMEFLAKNPNGQVPVLEDGDFTLSESCAIAQYLADHTPGQTIYPSEPRARADIHRWMYWSVQHFSPAIGVLTWERQIKPMIGAGDPDPREIARGETQFAKFAAVLDAHLADREWISGNTLTLADFAVAAPMMHAAGAKAPMDSLKNLQRWFARIQQLDAWKQASA